MKVGLVLEGGAMRGIWTCGVLDTLMDNNIDVDGIIGTSAGGIFGVNYFSKQKGRVIRYSKKFCKDRRYMGLLSFLLTGNIINKKFAYYKVSKKYDIFDNETFIKNNKEFYVTATNIETGKSEYFKITNPMEQLEELRATSAIPLVSRPVKINNKKYLDGGISDSIPIEKMKSLGYDKIIVILTRPLDYRKRKSSTKKEKMVKIKYKKYPNLINTMLNRYKEYNDTVDIIKKEEKENKIFVIRPSKALNIKKLERDRNKLQETYDLGIEDGKNILKDLKEYLKKEK